ncbi:MAG: hypothetical protein IKU37_03255 [Candidatus Gastranaerophilales bacterium]|nr:hypothetical protein [Candidatus Gastranaerophilales bacterium]
MVNTSLIILLLTTTICIIALSVFVIKFVISITKLSDNASTIATSVSKEIEPTLQELKEAVKSINSIANNADIKFKNAKVGIASALGLTACFGGKLKDFIQGISKGISFGMKMFKK